MDSNNSQILSHNPNREDSLEKEYSNIQNRLKAEHVGPALEERLNLLEELTKFEFGRFLLKNSGGWDGYWTWNVINRPNHLEIPFTSALEEFLFLKAPTVEATRERFAVFQRELEIEIKPQYKLASVPCGVMADFLTLDAAVTKDCQLVGLDLDQNSLELAAALALKHNKQSQCEFIKADAWELPLDGECEILTSNGLNIYERDDKRVVDLYKSFASALKPGGLLITSFLTLPPTETELGEWNLSSIDKKPLLLQRKVFGDILNATWASYRSSERTKSQLMEAGFERIEILSGSSGMFPTVKAWKSA